MIKEDFYRQAGLNLFNQSVFMDGSTLTFNNYTVLSEAEAVELLAEVAVLEGVYASKQYARDRKSEYDKLNQFELQFDDKQDSGTRWVDAINTIKAQFPKESN